MFTRARIAFITTLSLLLSASLAWSAEGIVVDGVTGEPVAGALVTLQATEVRTQTGVDGRFHLDAEIPAGSRLVAAAVGYYNEGADWQGAPLRFEMEALSFDAATDVAFPSPTECAACHPKQFEQWHGSPMAHAGRNRWVYDMYNGTGTPGGQGGFVYTRDSIYAEENEASECAACHAPERWVDAPGSPLPAFDALETPEERGVTCALCHTVSKVDISKSNFPGFFEGSATLHRGALVRFAVLGDVDYHAPGRMRASYQPQLSAELCSTCHQDSNDPSGAHTFDGPISEPTFEEWRASPYADPTSPHFSTCAECHSSALDVPQASVVGEGYTRPLGQIRSHVFEGTTPEFLEKALSLEVLAEPTQGELRLSVTLKNTGTGHHVPTGVTIRNMILLVEATQNGEPLELRDGPVLHELAGIGDPAKGYYAGLPGRLYAKINETKTGEGPTLFTEAHRIRSDNRIPALGEDHSEYTFVLPPNSADIEYRVRVIYRRSWRALLDQKDWGLDGHNRPLADIQPPHFGHLMAESKERVELPKKKASGSSCATTGPQPPSPWLLAAVMGLGIWRMRRLKADRSSLTPSRASAR